MNENIEKLKIIYLDGKIEEIDNTENKQDISIDMCSRCIWINQYKKKGQEGQIISRIIFFEQIKELEVVR